MAHPLLRGMLVALLVFVLLVVGLGALAAIGAWEVGLAAAVAVVTAVAAGLAAARRARTAERE